MRVADPTIADVFEPFLAETDEPMSERPFTDPRGVVELLEHCLDAYAYESLSDEEERFWRSRWDEDEIANSFCRTFGPEKILEHVDLFLGWFIIRKVLGGPETAEAAGPVTAELIDWLVRNGHVSEDEARAAGDRAREASNELPRAEKLSSLLYELTKRDVPGQILQDVDIEDDIVTISRIEPGNLWFDHLDGARIGPVSVPPEASKLAAVGWEVSATHFVKARTGWHLVEVGNVYPR